MLLIPAIDLRGGHCVRLSQGNFGAETRYPLEPEELLQHYRSLGATWLHVVDLDGARDGAPINMPLIARLARERDVRLQVGGGVRGADLIETLLSAGVARVVIGSAAVLRPLAVTDWLRRFGPERICLALDVRLNSTGEPLIQTHGWTRVSAFSPWEAIKGFPADVVKHVMCTDISRDGTLGGPNLELYRVAVARFPHLAWQASGGIRNATDLAALERLGLAAAVSGKALLEGRIPIEELQPFLPDASSPVSTSATARS